MKEQNNMRRVGAIKRRAAEIRHSWSPTERQRRMGLPPDAPWGLLKDLFASYRPAPAPAGGAQDRRGKNWGTPPRGLIR
jgi:hypothetical protein